MAFYMQFAVGADNEQIATNKYDMKIAQRYRKALDFKRNRVLLGGPIATLFKPLFTDKEV